MNAGRERFLTLSRSSVSYVRHRWRRWPSADRRRRAKRTPARIDTTHSVPARDLYLSSYLRARPVSPADHFLRRRPSRFFFGSAVSRSLSRQTIRYAVGERPDKAARRSEARH